MAEKSIINIRALARTTGIDHYKIRNNLMGKYKTDSLSVEEKTMLINAFHKEVTPILEKLGYFVAVKKLDKKES